MAEMMMEKVKFTALANGGAALGRLSDGRVVFAHGILPGESALIQYAQTDARYVNGELVDVIEPSGRRIEPACPLFGICSGCRLQMLTDADQKDEKRAILADQLRRIAKLSDPISVFRATIPSPASWNYRKSARFYVSPDGELCFPTNNPDELVPVSDCPICSTAINALLPSLSFLPESGISEIEIREANEGDMQLILFGEAARPETEIAVDFALSVVYSSPDGSYVMAGDSTILQTIAGVEIAASEENNFYVNPAIFDAVSQEMLTWLPAGAGDCVLNLNAGTGFWSKWFADKAAQVIAQDPAEGIAEDFSLNLDAFENVTLYIGYPRDILPGLWERPKSAVCEAGPAGLHKETVDALAAIAVQRVFYVGEDASILARDASRMQEQGYRLSAVIPFDDAPQTEKISALCVFDLGGEEKRQPGDPKP